MRSAPTDALDACTDLFPFHLLIEKLVYRATLKLEMLPQSHLLETHVNKALVRYVKKHRAPMHKVLHAFNIWPINFEAITLCRHSLKWCPSFPICVPTSKEVAFVKNGFPI